MRTCVVFVALLAIVFGQDCDTLFTGFDACRKSAMETCELIVCNPTSSSGSHPSFGKAGGRPGGPMGGGPGMEGHGSGKQQWGSETQSSAAAHFASISSTQKEAMESCMKTACPHADSHTTVAPTSIHAPMTFCEEKAKCMCNAMNACKAQFNITAECRTAKKTEMEAKMETARITMCECAKEHLAECAAEANITLPTGRPPMNCSAPMSEMISKLKTNPKFAQFAAKLHQQEKSAESLEDGEEDCDNIGKMSQHSGQQSHGSSGKGAESSKNSKSEHKKPTEIESSSSDSSSSKTAKHGSSTGTEFVHSSPNTGSAGQTSNVGFGGVGAKPSFGSGGSAASTGAKANFPTRPKRGAKGDSSNEDGKKGKGGSHITTGNPNAKYGKLVSGSPRPTSPKH